MIGSHLLMSIALWFGMNSVEATTSNARQWRDIFCDAYLEMLNKYVVSTPVVNTKDVCQASTVPRRYFENAQVSIGEIQEYVSMCYHYKILENCGTFMEMAYLNNFEMTDLQIYYNWLEEKSVQSKFLHICPKAIWDEFHDDKHFHLETCLEECDSEDVKTRFAIYMKWWKSTKGEKYCDCQNVNGLIKVFQSLLETNEWPPINAEAETVDTRLKGLLDTICLQATARTWTPRQYKLIDDSVNVYKYDLDEFIKFIKDPVDSAKWGGLNSDYNIDIMNVTLNEFVKRMELPYEVAKELAEYLASMQTPETDPYDFVDMLREFLNYDDTRLQSLVEELGSRLIYCDATSGQRALGTLRSLAAQDTLGFYNRFWHK